MHMYSETRAPVNPRGSSTRERAETGECSYNKEYRRKILQSYTFSFRLRLILNFFFTGLRSSRSKISTRRACVSSGA